MKRGILCLLFLLCFALLLASCKTQPQTGESSSFDRSEDDSSSAVSSEESSEPTVKEPQWKQVSVSASSIPAARSDLQKRELTETDTDALRTFCETYTGTFPAIADVICTERECFVCVVYEVEKQQVLCDWICVDPLTGEWKQGQDETPTPYAYDKNTYNQNGSFFIESDAVGASGPYTLHYRANGEDRVLLREEKDTVYARIIRQTDDYAVLSLLENEERSYLLVDQSGNVLSKTDWISDTSMVSPLMFGEGVLYCKTDSDEDYVYDTVGEIDLQTGEYRDLLSVGNCDYWTYFASGSGIVMYVGEQSSEFLYFDTASETLQTVPLKAPIASLDVTDGCVFGTLSGEQAQLFVWEAASQRLFDASCHASVVNGNALFASFAPDRLDLYSVIR